MAERHVGYHYAGRHEPRYARRDGQIDVVIGENTYEVSISQESPNSADEEKVARLLLELSGYRSINRYRWADRKRRRVEDWLSDVCDELEARATADDQYRIDQAREAAERRTRWQAAMDRARFHALEAHRTKVLTAQVEQWTLANAIRTYCDALGQRLAQIEDPDESAAEWLTWARARAASLDPLTSVPTMPPDPELTAEELKPHLGRWSPYGPDAGRAGWR
ncbi:hypothetical protein ACFX43_10705 [Nocardioides sp. YIM B13467]|uniref:hypothetical protein n=1 Tax=Nocardioides sp. YIM B13467 TaxID=3366294 RepID=UPI00366F3C55